MRMEEDVRLGTCAAVCFLFCCCMISECSTAKMTTSVATCEAKDSSLHILSKIQRLASARIVLYCRVEDVTIDDGDLSR